MAILPIATLGHPILRKLAEPLDKEKIPSPEIQQHIKDMLSTVEAADGAGLAAPQVHISLRIVVLKIDSSIGMEVWINPAVEALTDEHMLTFEGCLSVPELRGCVARPNHIRVSGLNQNGDSFDRVLEGYPAVVAQHEIDHLDGILFVDRIEPQSLVFLDMYRKYTNEIITFVLGEEKE